MERSGGVDPNPYRSILYHGFFIVSSVYVGICRYFLCLAAML